MKLVDHWIGLPVCYGLGFINFLFRPFFRKPKPVTRILVSKFFGMGSIILSFPLLKGLRDAYPESEITYLTFRSNVTILNLLDISIRVELIDDRTLLSLLLSTVKLIVRNIVSPYDLMIDLEFYSKYATIVSFFSLARTKVGFYYPALWRKLLYNAPVYFNFSKHILDIYGMVGQRAGVAYYSKAFPPIKIPDSAVEAIEEYFQFTKHREVRIGINVNASDLCYGRRWSKEKFAELIGSLSQTENCTIFLIGSRSEAEYTKECYDMIPTDLRKNVYDVAGRFTILEFLAFLRSLDLFITNDSGPLHMAFLVGTPSISIWGPGDPRMYGPIGENHSFLYKDYPCSPCMYIYRTDPGKFCDYKFPCMREIEVSELLHEVLISLNKEAKVGS